LKSQMVTSSLSSRPALLFNVAFLLGSALWPPRNFSMIAFSSSSRVSSSEPNQSARRSLLNPPLPKELLGLLGARERAKERTTMTGAKKRPRPADPGGPSRLLLWTSLGASRKPKNPFQLTPQRFFKFSLRAGRRGPLNPLSLYLSLSVGTVTQLCSS